MNITTAITTSLSTSRPIPRVLGCGIDRFGIAAGLTFWGDKCDVGMTS